MAGNSKYGFQDRNQTPKKYDLTDASQWDFNDPEFMKLWQEKCAKETAAIAPIAEKIEAFMVDIMTDYGKTESENHDSFYTYPEDGKTIYRIWGFKRSGGARVVLRCNYDLVPFIEIGSYGPGDIYLTPNLSRLAEQINKNTSLQVRIVNTRYLHGKEIPIILASYP